MQEYSENFCNFQNVSDKTWHSIDTNFVLPGHLELNQMPGLFRGDVKIAAKRKKGKFLVKSSVIFLIYVFR